MSGAATPLQPIHKTDVSIPQNYRQAINSSHRDYWQAAMTTQIDKLHAAHTWSLVPPAEMTRPDVAQAASSLAGQGNNWKGEPSIWTKFEEIINSAMDK